MTNRVHNFGAGPGALPLAVLEQVRDELLARKVTCVAVIDLDDGINRWGFQRCRVLLYEYLRRRE